MVESLPYKQVVGGSNPSRCTKIYVRNIFYNHFLLDIFRNIHYNYNVVWSKTSHVVWVRGGVAEWSKATVCKTVKPSVQIRPSPPIMETWQSPVYCNSLENCRTERFREFESHRFRQTRRVGRVVMHRIANPPFRKRRTGSSPVLSATWQQIFSVVYCFLWIKNHKNCKNHEILSLKTCSRRNFAWRLSIRR